jgi:hypothetical protein
VPGEKFALRFHVSRVLTCNVKIIAQRERHGKGDLRSVPVRLDDAKTFLEKAIIEE